MIYRYSRKVSAYGVQPCIFKCRFENVQFLLTHPLRGATIMASNCLPVQAISTHTPLAGCNDESGKTIDEIKNFYSHTPCGVQLMRIKLHVLPQHFYSHTPCGVQLNVHGNLKIGIPFLLTHPLRGATRCSSRNC